MTTLQEKCACNVSSSAEETKTQNEHLLIQKEM